eukprot:2790159-Amphidinium_carterae.1
MLAHEEGPPRKSARLDAPPSSASGSAGSHSVQGQQHPQQRKGKGKSNNWSRSDPRRITLPAEMGN